jgi:glycosyltransferase involved in cell wall biosynthesis
MILDRYQLVISSKSFRGTNIQVSGILFNPYPRIPATKGGFIKSVKNSLRKIKKRILFKFMLRNKNIDTLYVLNDSFTVKFLNKKCGNDRKLFQELPDPVPQNKFPVCSKINVEERYNIDPQSKKLLVFGQINQRKNVENILDAVSKVSDMTKEKFTLLIIGKCSDPSYEQILRDKSQQIESDNDRINIVFENKFVSESQKETIFAGIDVVMAIYRNFYSSSGVLGQAVRFGKPIIVSKFGLMGSLVEDYKLGEVVDPKDQRSIIQSINKTTSNKEDYLKDHSQFLKERTPKEFARVLLN